MFVIGARLRSSLADECGFSLIELLVACLIGTIVLGGAFTVVEVAARQTGRIDQRVDTVQRGRIAMEAITKTLRSQTCLGPGVPAITQADDNSVTFYADGGSNPFMPERHRLSYSGGAIVHETYTGTGTPPSMTFSATPSGRRVLIDRVAANGSTPIFRYFAFSTTDPVRPSLLLSTPLAAPDMARTVQVDVSFVAQPLQGDPNDKMRTVLENSVFARTSDPGDPERSPQCI